MIDEGPIEALIAWGASPSVVAQWRRHAMEQAKGQAVEIWPQHWNAWCVFVGMETQWRSVAGARGLVRLGLDYAALPIVIAENRGNPHRVPLAELMPQLRTLEHAAALEMIGED